MAMEINYGRLSAEDFDTASIRSAAPSYVSEAPSYHSTVYPTETAPPYSPPARTSHSSTPRSMVPPTSHSSSTSNFTPPPRGLPRVPSPRRQNEPLQLNDFRVGTWSTVHSNPTYARVAHRRANAARHNSSVASVETAFRTVLQRMNAEEAERVRPLEDPYLVGEEAASRARNARLARQNGTDILILEDMRWDRFLAQMKDREDRERAFQNTRREMETTSRRGLLGRLAR